MEAKKNADPKSNQKNAPATNQKKKEYIKLGFGLDDDSVRILMLEKKKALISFNFDATAGVVISVFMYALSKEDPVHSITSQMAVTPSRGEWFYFIKLNA